MRSFRRRSEQPDKRKAGLWRPADLSEGIVPGSGLHAQCARRLHILRDNGPDSALPGGLFR